MNYKIVIEETTLGYSAHSPDVDGCVATGSTREGVMEAIRELIDAHLEWLGEHAPRGGRVRGGVLEMRT